MGQWRQIGLGIMGLADCLIKLGLTYGEEDAIEMCDNIGFAMADSAIAASALLAKEKGAFENAILMRSCPRRILRRIHLRRRGNWFASTACATPSS